MFQTNVVEKIKTLFMFKNISPQNRAIYKIMRKNMIDPDAYFHFIHAFGNGRRSYASEPVAKSVK